MVGANWIVIAGGLLAISGGALYFALSGLFDGALNGKRRHPTNSRAPAPPPVRAEAPGQYVLDPVCRRQVPLGDAVAYRAAGEVVYFCSPACREKYRFR